MPSALAKFKFPCDCGYEAISCIHCIRRAKELPHGNIQEKNAENTSNVTVREETCPTCNGEGCVETIPAGAGHPDDLAEYAPCPDCGLRKILGEAIMLMKVSPWSIVDDWMMLFDSLRYSEEKLDDYQTGWNSALTVVLQKCREHKFHPCPKCKQALRLDGTTWKCTNCPVAMPGRFA